MKEMRLFEVGLKDWPHSTGYSYKYYVAAEDAHEAEDKAREHIMREFKDWWAKEGIGLEVCAMKEKNIEPTTLSLDEALQFQLDELKELHLSKVLDIGTIII